MRGKKERANQFYDDAMEQLSEKHGDDITTVVHAVIQSRGWMSTLIEQLHPLVTDEDDREKLKQTVVELVSINVGSLCALVKQDFSVIRELADGVMAQVTRDIENAQRSA